MNNHAFPTTPLDERIIPRVCVRCGAARLLRAGKFWWKDAARGVYDWTSAAISCKAHA